jgi:hypothetical protein
MANLKLKNPSGGSLNLVSADGASDLTVTFPAGTGTAVVNGVSSSIVSGTAVASTSGTSIDFTGIPSWVKRITVMLSDVSTNGASLLRLRVGTSSGIETTGYTSTCSYIGPSVSTASSSSGFDGFGDDSATYGRSGIITLALLSSNKWSLTGGYNYTSLNYQNVLSGTKTLAGTLDRVRITTVNGTDTFDAGTINILYE